MKTAEQYEALAEEHERVAEQYKQMNALDSYKLRKALAAMARERAEEIRREER